MEVVIPAKPTSRCSNVVIDFGITNDASGWQTEVLQEGTSDHRPLLFQSPYCKTVGALFRKTNWNVFTFFLSAIFDYWNTMAYNFDHDPFIELFSLFLSALWDRCSVHKKAEKYRPPWPSTLVTMAHEVNGSRRRYRRSRSITQLEDFLHKKKAFIFERCQFLQTKREN